MTIPPPDASITPQEVERIARLARLDVSADETEMFAAQLTRILEHAADVQRVNTDGVEPTSHAAGGAGALRDDARMPSLDRRAVRDMAPDMARDVLLFRVPKVL